MFTAGEANLWKLPFYEHISMHISKRQSGGVWVRVWAVCVTVFAFCLFLCRCAGVRVCLLATALASVFRLMCPQ